MKMLCGVLQLHPGWNSSCCCSLQCVALACAFGVYDTRWGPVAVQLGAWQHLFVEGCMHLQRCAVMCVPGLYASRLTLQLRETKTLQLRGRDRLTVWLAARVQIHRII